MSMLKIYIAIILSTIGSGCCAQKSDLYRHVDSLIRYQLNFSSTDTARHAIRIADTSHRFAIQDHATLFPSFPLIIVNDHPVRIDRLNNAGLIDVRKITVLKSAAASALYGSEGVYGAIFIEGKKNLLKKLFRK